MAKGITELISDFKVLHPRAYERIYEQGRADERANVIEEVELSLREAHYKYDENMGVGDNIGSAMLGEFAKGYNKGYEYGVNKGRADELDKISKMMLLGCDELKCEECDYRLYSQDVCQQAYTIGIIENYIAEQLKEKK